MDHIWQKGTIFDQKDHFSAKIDDFWTKNQKFKNKDGRSCSISF